MISTPGAVMSGWFVRADEYPVFSGEEKTQTLIGNTV